MGKVWGAITLGCSIICLMPFLGWGNWVIIPFALIGCIISAFSEGYKGLWLNVIALIVASLRLLLGGGIL